MICRVCGCTDERACPLGCWWAAPEVCSNCTAWKPAPEYDMPLPHKVVDCITGIHFFIPGLTVLSVIGSTEQPAPHKAVRLWNSKTKRWEDWAYVDHAEPCPVCKTPMRVFAIRGTTWLACCGESCYETYFATHPELQITTRWK